MTSSSTTVPGSLAAIEPATWRDLNPLRQIEKECFSQDAWPLWDLIGVLTLPNIVRLKASVNGDMIGFIAGDIRRSEGLAWIATVAVLPAYQRRGIGQALMLSCEAQLHVGRVRLSVRLSNTPAIRMYENLGYIRVGTWPDYYQGNEDALIMEKLL
jgi:ribosomal-protein-alanine N-acetyltransferase